MRPTPLILDDKKRQFTPVRYSSEANFEQLVKSLSDSIFGTSTLYLDVKKRIKKNEIISVPGGYLLDLTQPKEPKLYVVENELANHDAFRHIGIQLLKFITGFDESKTTIREFLMAKIQSHQDLLERLEDNCKRSSYRNIDNYLDAAVYQDFKGLVIIDEVQLELNQVLSKINADISVLELKTYQSEDGSFVYQFDTLYDEYQEPVHAVTAASTEKKEGRALRRAFRASCDTIVVPAREEGFKRVFIGEQKWYAIRIGAAMKDRIKYIAAYQVAPISTVTHIAEVQEIRPYKNSGKYMVIFKGAPEQITPIPIRDPNSKPQGPIYVRRERLLAAKTLEEAKANEGGGD